MPWTTPETFTAGQTLTAASMNKLSDNDAWLKAMTNVTQATMTDVNGISNVVASFIDVQTGGGTVFTASITPTFATSKVLVTVRLMVGASISMYCGARLLRGTTVIGAGAAAGSRTTVTAQTWVDSAHLNQIVINFLDSPATTSAVTYKTQLAPFIPGTVYINQTGSSTDTNAFTRGMSTITLQEVPVP